MIFGGAVQPLGWRCAVSRTLHVDQVFLSLVSRLGFLKSQTEAA
jgi:hypothetical protein